MVKSELDEGRFRIERWLNPSWTKIKSELDEGRFRIGRAYNPNWTKVDSEMADLENALHPRFAAAVIKTALEDTPVVLVTGPRQCGKTTLVRDLVAGKREFLTM